MYILVSVVSREITVKKFNTHEEARNQMITELKRATDYSEKEWSEAMELCVRCGWIDDGEIGLSKRMAYFNGVYDWDWEIFNLEEEN